MKITNEMLNYAEAEVLKSIPQTTYKKLSALNRHVLAFAALLKTSKTTEDEQYKIVYSGKTIAETLKKLKEPNPALVGNTINMFNSTHSNHCPFGYTIFSQNNAEPNPSVLHLGTLRIYNPDGTINPIALDELNALAKEKSETEDVTFVRQSDALNLLNTHAKNDPDDPLSGRNARNCMSSSYIQKQAAIEAWKEIFKLFACGYIPRKDNPTQNEPCVDVAFLKLFFENSIQAIHVAIAQNLPQKQILIPVSLSSPSDTTNIELTSII